MKCRECGYFGTSTSAYLASYFDLGTHIPVRVCPKCGNFVRAAKRQRKGKHEGPRAEAVQPMSTPGQGPPDLRSVP